MHAVQVTNLLNTLITRRVRERGEAAAPVSPCSFNRKKHKKYECESDDDDGELPPYSPISEDKYGSESESESLSDIEYCFSRQIEEHGNAKDGFRQQLERILCRDQSSPIPTLHLESGVSFSESRIWSSSTSSSDDEGSIRSSSIAKKSRFYLH